MPAPSSVRVFAKSLHILAATWLISVTVLWGAQLRQDRRLNPASAADLHVETILEGILPALGIELSAIGVARWAAAVPGVLEEHREWVHAIWWSLLPIVLLVETVYLIVWPT